ncbi:hypothetical protein FEM48_Zijuj12G0041900 [Ziziphus jujuba var. spinosa]|uniref:UDP-glycosyltransferase 86A1-like n=1 Tax=Ziziphus jujuba var. spinosa TaxID=714518 RepID=A0A978UB39_ZIZJJ|nr:hypothetical protein FEM48_Zijuj12G0041900 [Ziziphus jujuba var. spinosa]
METTHPKPHAVMFPLHLQGHVIPAVHLAVKLASKGFTITFVNTQAIHRQIIKSRSQNHHHDQDIFAGARKSGLDIRYKTVTDGFPLSFNRSLNREQFIEGFLHVFPAHVDELVGNIIAADPSVSCLIADTFHSWPSSIAQKYNLVHISFWTEPALVFNLYYHLDLLVKNCHFASHDNREDTIDYIPGVEAIEPKDLMSYLRETEVSTLMHKIIYKAFEDVKKADFILCNTVEELELHAISAVRGKQPIYAIGPVLSNIGQNGSIVATSLRSQSDCSQWLDTKPHGSVLYVSFGSMSPVNEHDMEELAQGLLLSKVCFVWVLRPDTMSDAESYALPVGFEDDIKERGLIVPWKLVVDDWRAGLNLCDKKPLTRFEVREKISSLMSGKSAEVLREEMKKVKEIIHNAVDKDGSSEKRISETELKLKPMEMETTHPKPHAIMIPLCFQGHITPTVHLAIKLASNGFTITFINTESIHHQIIKSRPQDDDNDDQDIFAGARKSGLDIRYKTVTDGFPLSFNRMHNLKQFCEGLFHVFPAHVDELVGNIVGDDPSVTCLIADALHPWPSTIAKNYNLVHISFTTEPALVFTLYYHVDLLIRNGHVASHDNREDTIDYIPGVQAIQQKDLMSHLQQTDISTAVHRLIFKAFEGVKKADYILCNTVEELEPHAISAIREKQPIYAIGPLFSSIGQNGSIVATSLRSKSDCSQWLDTKPHGSVLYASFETLALLNEHDVEEIAQGLLLSKVSFVWALRPDIVSFSESYVLPDGFEDEIKDRGLIIPWCNQIEENSG